MKLGWQQAHHDVISCCCNDHIHIELRGEDNEIQSELVLKPEDAYAFAQRIISAYDKAAGLV